MKLYQSSETYGRKVLDLTMIRKCLRYKENLMLIDDKVISYTTHVATIKHKTGELIQWRNWSKTTQKHINYVANYLNLKLIRP
jgi:hypothetical protein